MRLITPTILILIAIGVFFGYVDPMYENVKDLREREAQFNDALDRSRDLISIRDELLSKYNTFTTAELDRLEKLLPDNVDNVRLVLDIDNIAARYGMSLKNVSVAGEGSPEGQPVGFVDPSGEPFESIILDFTVTAPYGSFIQFLNDLENSLRVVDVVSLAFTAGDVDFNQYDVGIKTYWLK